MNHGPLHDLHETSNAQCGPVEGFSIPLVYSTADADYDATRTGAGLIDLAHVGTVRLEGPDARRFCNGMFTNNIRDLQPGQCGRSAMCDDRGRVLGLLDLLCTDPDRFDGVLEGVSAEWFESRYGMYIVFDDVELEVSQSGPWVLSLQGPQSATVLEHAGLPAPNKGHHSLSEDGIRIVDKDRSGLGGFDLIVETDQAPTLWQRLLSAGCTPIGHTTLERLRIEHGRARWPVDGTEKSLVHELGIDSEVCNFNKGCYLGQEVINRVDVKGQVNKKLHKILLDTQPKELLGAPILLDDVEVGTITSATDTETGAIALAVIRKRAWAAGQEVTISTVEGAVSGSVQDAS